ncbi:MAG: hypothetical protein KAH24_02600 [Holophagae bacterium]|nr:hypothetical protein [Holophagae bacterium]
MNLMLCSGRCRLIAMLLFLSVLPCKAIVESKIVDKYADGTPKREVTYHNSEKLGETIYSPDGVVEIKKDYLWNSYPWGIWARYDKNGKEVDRGNFLINLDNRDDESYENSFIYHKKDGEYRENYPNGKLKLKTAFKKGKITGNLLMFHQDGRLFYKTEVTDGKPEYILEYYDNGTMRVHIYTNGKCDYIDLFNEEGMLVSQRISKADPYLFRDYREDGRMKREILYKEGFGKFRSRTYGEDGYCIPENQYNYEISLTPCTPPLSELGQRAAFHCLYRFKVHTDTTGVVVSTEELKTSTSQAADRLVDLKAFQDCMKHWRLFPNKTYTVTLSFGTSEMNKNKIWIRDENGFDFALSLSPVWKK